MPRLLELFSGTGSVGRAFAELGWEVISLDLDPGAEPTICADVCSWEPVPMFAPGYFDMIWASPPCAEYSRALTQAPQARGGRSHCHQNSGVDQGPAPALLVHRESSDRAAEAPALHGELAVVRCDLLQVRLSLQEGHAAVAQLALGAPARPLLRALALCAVRGQRRAAPFGGAEGHFPPQRRDHAELPQPGPALQHPRGAVRRDRLGRQRSSGHSRYDPLRRLLDLGFSSASNLLSQACSLPCSRLHTPHSTAVSLP